MSKTAAEYINIEQLKPWDKNPRKNDHAVIEVKQSIQRFGFSAPIIARKSDNVIIAGHTRWKAAKEIGLKEVPVRFMDLDVVDSQLLAIADNKLNERADWDEDLLEQVLQDLAGEDLTGIGFDDNELQDIIDKISDTDTKEENEDLPELEEEVYSKEGEIYELGPHRLLCGDSTLKENWEKLLGDEKVNMILTDPPYGMNLNVEISNRKGGKGTWIHKAKNYTPVIGDNEDFKDSLITSIFAIFPNVEEIFIWGADYFAELIPNRKKGSWFVWDKRFGVENMKLTFSEFELCWSKKKHHRCISRITWSGILGTEQEFDHKRHHPTQKPIKLINWMFEQYGKEKDIVIDFYGGSGSTLLGCAASNRICRLIELDPKYCDVIRRRWTRYATENGLEVGTGGLE